MQQLLSVLVALRNLANEQIAALTGEQAPAPAAVGPATVATAATTPPPAKALPSAGDIAVLRRSGVEKIVREHSLPINIGAERDVAEIKRDIIAHLNVVNAPTLGATPAPPPAALAAPAPAAPAPAAPAPAAPAPAAPAPAAPAPAAPPAAVAPPPPPPAAPPPAAAPPAPVAAAAAAAAAPAVAAAPPPPAPTPAVSAVTERWAAFQAGMRKLLEEEQGNIARCWTNVSLRMAGELEPFLQQTMNFKPASGTPADENEQTTVSNQSIFRQYFAKLGCQGNCSTCPVGPQQVPVCYALWDTNVAGFKYNEIAEPDVKPIKFKSLPPEVVGDARYQQSLGFAYAPEYNIQEWEQTPVS